MAEMTNFFELAFLDFWFNNTNFTKPAALEVSWLAADPTDTGSVISEVDLTGGARSQVSFADSTGGARQVANTNQVDIASAANPGTITHWGLHQTGGGNEMLCYATLSPQIVVSAGSPVRINIGGMVWDFPSNASPNQVFTDYVVDNWLSQVFGTSTFATLPTSWQVALYDGIPGDAGAANEFADAGYTRQAATWDNAAAATSGDTTDSWVRNTGILNWTNLNSASNDPTISYWGVFDHTNTFLARRDQADSPVSPGSNASALTQSLALRCN